MSGYLSNVVEEKEISSIQFGVFSNEEILKMSVAEINKSKLSTEHSCVYDIRLGTLDNSVKCETCNSYPKDCPGHYGHIKLNKPIIHPLFYKQVTTLINCFCIKCYRFVLSKEQLELKGLLKITGKNRISKISKYIQKVDECYYCSNPIPEFKFIASEKTIHMVYKEDNEKLSIPLSVEEIKNVFDRICDEDIELLGFDKNLMQPKNLIMLYFIVIPPASRPYVVSDGNFCDDDLTNQIMEIIKINNALGKEKIPLNKSQKLIQSLKFRISTFYNNSNDKAKHSTNGRPMKCLKKRITGKSGQIRDNLMGKRGEKTARTVIGPDPTLKLNQLAVPRRIAKDLTIPEKVTMFNIKRLTKIVNNNEAKHLIKSNGRKINLKYALHDLGTRLQVGDIILRNDQRINVDFLNHKLKVGDRIIRAGKILTDIKYPKKRIIDLEIGDIVERRLKDGDLVLLNRQPTLHAASMQGMEIVIRDNKTFRFNLAIAKPFNADFNTSESNREH